MAVLVPGRAFSTPDPQLHVENVLERGSYRFRLVVFDDSQNESLPADIIVLVATRREFDLGNFTDLIRDFMNTDRVLRPGDRE